MSSDSPLAVLFSKDGYAVNITDGYAIAAGQPSTIASGKDGSTARFITVDSSGHPIIVGAGTAGSPSGGVLTIQGAAGAIAYDATLAKLTISQNTALGSNTQALMGGSVTTGVPTYTNGNINPLSLTTSGLLRIDGSSVTQPVSGTVTANIGTTNGLALDTTLAKLTVAQSTALGSNTQAMVGGSVTTAAPTYTTGNINPLSLTTAGALRTDSSATTQPISGSVTVTQATAGNLNATVVGSGNFSVIGTGFDNTTNSTTKLPVLPARANTSAPNWTDGYMVPLSVTTGGALRTFATNNQPVTFGDSSNLDSYNRLRVSNPQSLFDSKQLSDSQPLSFDDQQTSGSGTTSTFLTNQAATRLSVSTAAGTRVRQSYLRFNYQPGKGLFIAETAILGAAATGITRRVGYFDGNNGLFFQLSGSVLSTVVRTNTSGSPTDTAVAQSSWNLDKLDGTGASGITLDVTKAQIFIIDFQWLGVGRIRFGVNIAGTIVYVHQVLNANVLANVYMSVPNLPIRYEISNSGAGAASDLIHICSSVISEGGRDNNGIVLSIDRGATSLVTNNDTNLYPLLAIRLKTTYQTAAIEPVSFSVICTSASVYKVSVLLNPTVAGTALSFSSITNSSIEAATAATNATTVSGGTLIQSFYVDATGTQSAVNTAIPQILRLGSNIAGVSDIVVLAVQRIVGTTETFYASLMWRETN